MELRGRETGARAALTVLSTKGDFFYFSFFFLWVAHNVFPVNRGLSRGVSTIPQPVIMSVGNECFTAGGGGSCRVYGGLRLTYPFTLFNITYMYKMGIILE